MAIEGLNQLLNTMGTIHFIGIGGIGISGLAEICHNLGYKVQGSDLSNNANTQRLKEMGIKIFTGHEAKNIDEAGFVVKSSAVKDDNPEIIAARAAGVPVVKRSEMLAELMRLKISVAVAGTHGKTTTTSLVAHMFENAGKNPTVINGGIINTKNTNAYLGQGEYLIAEADESDATFIKVPATIGIITNIEPEHLDFYGNFEAVKSAFKTFIENLPFYGFGVLCADHEEVQNLIPQITDRKIITYGIYNKADVMATNIRKKAFGHVFDLEVSAHVAGKARTITDISLPIPGIHNVQNACASLAVGAALGFTSTELKNSFTDFEGVKRRFTKMGETRGVLFVDDYAHHPTEIMATLATARDVATSRGGRVISVMQPHRYSRLSDLFSEFSGCFGDSDIAFISEVYAAGEKPIPGISGEILVESIRNFGQPKDVRFMESPDRLAEILGQVVREKDLVVFLGAGSSTYWAARMPQEFEAII